MAKWARVKDRRIIEISDAPIEVNKTTTTGDVTVVEVGDDAVIGDEIEVEEDDSSA
jgi:hypothetical protein